MPETFVTLSAEARHLPFLPGIELAAAALFPPGSLPPHVLADTVPPSLLAEACEEGRLWVAVPEGGGEPVGFALFREVSGHALLAEVDVRPEYGRRGLGRRLVLRAILHAREAGFPAMYLTTFRTVPWNAPFYGKLGFSILCEERLPRFAADILRAERDIGLGDRVVMRRDLPLDGEPADE